MQARYLLSQNKRIVGIQRTGREVFHHQKAVVAVAAHGQHLRDGDRFAARQQFQLIGFGGENREQLSLVAFYEEIAP